MKCETRKISEREFKKNKHMSELLSATHQNYVSA